MIIPPGRDFMWQANATAVGAQKPNVHLWNPSAANTNLYVYRIVVSNIATGSTMVGWVLGRKDTTLTGSPVYAASSAIMRLPQDEVVAISCTTDTSTTLTGTGFTSLRKGMTISDALGGTKVTAGTRIASIESATSLTMTAVGAGAGTQSLTFAASAARIAATTSTTVQDLPNVSNLFRGVTGTNSNDIVDFNKMPEGRPIVLEPGAGLVCKGSQPGASAAGILSVTFFGRECPA